MSTKNILIAMVGGAIAGATAAVLLTPASGKETRKKLANISADAKDSIIHLLLSVEKQLAHCLEHRVGQDGVNVSPTATMADEHGQGTS